MLPDTASRQSQLAFRHGGLGLRSARLHAPAAFWASWADSLSAIQRRDPDLAQHIVRQLEHVSWARSRQPWPCSLGRGVDAPQPHDVEDDAPGIGRGWQKAASAAFDMQRAAAHSDNLDAASAAMLLSQSGTCSAQVFLMLPVCPELILEPAHFRVLLLRRLRLPGREQDALGDHRSACPRSVLNVGSVPGHDQSGQRSCALLGPSGLAQSCTLGSALVAPRGTCRGQGRHQRGIHSKLHEFQAADFRFACRVS